MQSPYINNTYKSGECHLQCPYSYYVGDDLSYHCLAFGEKCPTSHPFLIASTNQCVTSCRDPYSEFSQQNELYLFASVKCLSQCPSNYEIDDNNECQLSITGLSPPSLSNNTVIYSTISNAHSFTSSINDTVSTFIETMKLTDAMNQSLIIDSFDFKFQLYSTSNSDNFNSSKISLGDCEFLLREAYNISSNEELIIGQIIYSSQNVLSNMNKYNVYDSSGNQLDLSLCNRTKINIRTPITEAAMQLFNLTVAAQL